MMEQDSGAVNSGEPAAEPLCSPPVAGWQPPCRAAELLERATRERATPQNEQPEEEMCSSEISISSGHYEDSWAEFVDVHASAGSSVGPPISWVIWLRSISHAVPHQRHSVEAIAFCHAKTDAGKAEQSITSHLVLRMPTRQATADCQGLLAARFICRCFSKQNADNPGIRNTIMTRIKECVLDTASPYLEDCHLWTAHVS